MSPFVLGQVPAQQEAEWLGIGLASIALTLLIGVASLAVSIWGLFDLFRQPTLSTAAKTVWAIVLLFVPLLGPLAYVLARPRGSHAGAGPHGTGLGRRH